MSDPKNCQRPMTNGVRRLPLNSTTSVGSMARNGPSLASTTPAKQAVSTNACAAARFFLNLSTNLIQDRAGQAFGNRQILRTLRNFVTQATA